MKSFVYSDNWIKEGCQKSKPVELSQTANYYIWYSKDTAIGVSVNFEVADDVHYEMNYEEWLKFADYVKTSKDMRLEEYFEGIDWISFEQLLKQLELKYNKMAYYDFD